MLNFVKTMAWRNLKKHVKKGAPSTVNDILEYIETLETQVIELNERVQDLEDEKILETE